MQSRATNFRKNNFLNIVKRTWHEAQSNRRIWNGRVSLARSGKRKNILRCCQNNQRQARGRNLIVFVSDQTCINHISHSTESNVKTILLPHKDLSRAHKSRILMQTTSFGAFASDEREDRDTVDYNCLLCKTLLHELRYFPNLTWTELEVETFMSVSVFFLLFKTKWDTF